MYKIREVTYQEIDIDRGQLMTMAEAGRMLGITLSGVISAIERGGLTEIVDDEARFHGRRLLLKSEVEKMVNRKLVKNVTN